MGADYSTRPEIREANIRSIMALRADATKYAMPLMIEPLVMKDNADAAGGYMVDGDIDKIMTLVRQARELGFYINWSYAHPPAIKLAARIASLAPGDLNRVFFTSGGSEAVESAWKLARQFHKVNGEPLRTKIISREVAYHGTTFGAISITGITPLRTPFEPLVPEVRHVSNTNRYHRPAEETEEGQERIDYLTHEWSYGPYERTLQLPVPVDATRANVTFGNGVLAVTFPKAGATTSGRVLVQRTGQARGMTAGHLGSRGGAGDDPTPDDGSSATTVV